MIEINLFQEVDYMILLVQYLQHFCLTESSKKLKNRVRTKKVAVHKKTRPALCPRQYIIYIIDDDVHNQN